MAKRTTRQTAEPLQDFRLTAASAREALGIVDLLKGGDLIIPPYQRPSVWTEDQQVALIRSTIMGVPIPAIVWNDRATFWEGPKKDAYVYALIDGRQRVEAAVAWYDSKLPVPASWFQPDVVQRTERTDDGPYVRFSGLTKPGQVFFKRSFHFPVCEGRLPDVETEAMVYRLLNMGGTPQTAADMARAARVETGDAR